MSLEKSILVGIGVILAVALAVVIGNAGTANINKIDSESSIPEPGR
ncbi:hypothetical protein [Streptomyces sp. SM12]|nr:hypothetical protein [Streptomyces sp. SM12]